MSPIANTLLLEELNPFNSLYQFNHPSTLMDAEYWTAAFDGTGSCEPNGTYAGRILLASGAQNDDAYFHGNGVKNKCWEPSSLYEPGYSLVVWEAMVDLALPHADTLILMGLFDVSALPTAYAEVVSPCAQFFYDHDTVATNWVCRTWHAAEEETDSGVAATGRQSLMMIWTGASVTFYIDHVLVATHTTRVPINTLCTAALVRTEDGAGAGKYIVFKYINVWVSG